MSEIWAVLRADTDEESLVAAFTELEPAFAFADTIDRGADVRIVLCDPKPTGDQWDRDVPWRSQIEKMRYVNYRTGVTVVRG